MNDSHTSSSGKFALLPEEILLSIFSHMKPVIYYKPPSRQWFDYDAIDGETDEMDSEYDWSAPCDPDPELWTNGKILDVALTCRRFHRIVIPLLFERFEKWCQGVVKGVSGREKDAWSPCLKAVLRQPVLGSYLHHIEANMWGITEEIPIHRSWTKADFELASQAVHELCKCDIWRLYPASRRMASFRELCQISGEWSEAIRDGRCDAVLALLLALTPNLQRLTLSSFEAIREIDKEDFIDGDTNYVARILRGAAHSQISDKV